MTTDVGRSPSGRAAAADAVGPISAVSSRAGIPNAPTWFRLLQDGQVVASVRGERSFGMIGHYAHLYGRDGAVTVEYHDGKRWKALYSTGNPQSERTGA